MASIRLSSLLLLLFACAALAQAPQRVRGTIEAFDGSILSVAGSKIVVTDKTEIVFAQPINLADLKPGDFLGVTSARHGGGKLIAYEVRRFPKPVNPGHRPFDGRDDQTMTNATVEAMMQSASGRELTMTYAGGTQKITVPPDASVSTLVPGTRAQLVPGAPVNLTMGEDRVAIRIQVSPKK
jgi:Domain of unknown function (DUF5666)